MNGNRKRSIAFFLFASFTVAAIFSSCAQHSKRASEIAYPYIYKKGDCDYILVGDGGLINTTIRSDTNRIHYGNQTYNIAFDEYNCNIVDAGGLEIHDKLYY